MITYKVFQGIREIKTSELVKMDEETIFNQFLEGDYANNLILETDTHEKAIDYLKRKAPFIRIGNETMNKKKPVKCYWIEEYIDNEYAGTLEHSILKNE